LNKKVASTRGKEGSSIIGVQGPKGGGFVRRKNNAAGRGVSLRAFVMSRTGFEFQATKNQKAVRGNKNAGGAVVGLQHVKTSRRSGRGKKVAFPLKKKPRGAKKKGGGDSFDLAGGKDGIDSHSVKRSPLNEKNILGREKINYRRSEKTSPLEGGKGALHCDRASQRERKFSENTKEESGKWCMKRPHQPRMRRKEKRRHHFHRLYDKSCSLGRGKKGQKRHQSLEKHENSRG